MTSMTKRLPCRGCLSSCKNLSVCAGKPWRLPPDVINKNGPSHLSLISILTPEILLRTLSESPETLEFDQVIALINSTYYYSPTPFTNGIGEHKIVNEAGMNEGSCRIFSFAKLQGFTEQQTLSCFGKFYRDDVLKNPLGRDHANIRRFMEYGWMGIHFDGEALTPR